MRLHIRIFKPKPGVDPASSDEELMAALQEGRDGATVLFTRYREPVWRFFRRRVPDHARAEELAQDVFAALLEAAPRYQPRAPFRSYLFGIAYNVLLADRRKAGAPVQTIEADLAGRNLDPDASLWVRAALDRLDREDREILMLRLRDGFRSRPA